MADVIDHRAELKAARTQTRLNLSILGVLTLLSIGTCVYFLFLYEPTDAINLRPYLKVARDRIAEHSDTIVAEGAELAAETLPPVAETFYDQFRRDIPVYLAAFEEQGDVMVDHLAVDLRKRLKSEFKEFLVANRKVVAEEFPAYASQEAINRLEARFEQAAERLIDRYSVDEFQKQATRTITLWKKIEPVPSPEGRETLESQLLEYVADWALLKSRELATE